MRLLSIAAAGFNLETRRRCSSLVGVGDWATPWPSLDVKDECIVKRSAKIVNSKAELEWPGGGPGLSPRKHAARRGRFRGLGGLDEAC